MCENKSVLCFFYNEFNTETGAEIIYQYPENYLKQEDYLKISEFIIPRPELCHKPVSLKVGDAFILGHPIILEHKNYLRTNFQFNFTLIISADEYNQKSVLYEALINKIGIIFENLEIENQNAFLKDNHELIKSFVENLYKCLDRKDEVINIKIFENCFLFFKFLDLSKLKTEIQPYLVPVWIKRLDPEEYSYMDKKVLLVVQNIDGISYIKKISLKTGLDIAYVFHVIYNLLIKNCLHLVDIFQFSNIYRATPKLIKEFKSTSIRDFYNLADLNNHNNNKLIQINSFCEKYEERDTNEEYKMTINLLFSLYCELSNSENVNDFIKRNILGSISIHHFIAFGIINQFIRRIHIYPYKKKIFEGKESTQIENQSKILSLCDGKNHADKISCEMGLPTQEICDFVIKKGGILLYR